MLLIKIGGGKGINWEGICRDVSSLVAESQVIVVHGASARRDEMAERLSIPTKTVESPSGITSVYTDEEALDVFLMVYAGLVNKKIVALMHKHGVNAVGLSGVDGRLWQARAKKEILVKDNGRIKLLRGNLTGRVEGVNTHLIRLLVENGYVPVICPPALSFESEIVNTDNDLAIGAMIECLRIRRIISLFEAPGLLKDPDDETTLISRINKKRLEDYLNFARSRMKKKIMGAQKALEGGAEVVYWADGRVERPVVGALEGRGTVIC